MQLRKKKYIFKKGSRLFLVCCLFSYLLITKKFNFLKLLQGVLAGIIGVQSKHAAEDDFSQPTLIPYIIFGVIFVAIFVLTLIIIANKVSG